MTQTADAYWKQGTEKLEEYNEMVNNLIAIMPEPRRSQVKKMMDGPIGEQFMMAPASTRRSFHYAFPCGLVAHSLNVVRNAWKIADALWPGRWEKWQIAFVALFHDLGKAGSAGKPYYIPADDWKRKKEEYWEVSKQEYMPNSEKSVWLLLKSGIDLSYEETQAIRLNDGMGPAENKPYAFKENSLSLVVHWADHAAMRMEKEENGE
jgi:hypothetical protein